MHLFAVGVSARGGVEVFTRARVCVIAEEALEGSATGGTNSSSARFLRPFGVWSIHDPHAQQTRRGVPPQLDVQSSCPSSLVQSARQSSLPLQRWLRFVWQGIVPRACFNHFVQCQCFLPLTHECFPAGSGASSAQHLLGPSLVRVLPRCNLDHSGRVAAMTLTAVVALETCQLTRLTAAVLGWAWRARPLFAAVSAASLPLAS